MPHRSKIFLPSHHFFFTTKKVSMSIVMGSSLLRHTVKLVHQSRICYFALILYCANFAYFPKVLFFLLLARAKTFSGIFASKTADSLSGNTGEQEMDDMQ